MSTITVPVSGGAHGWPFAGYFGDIALQGYSEQEFFFAGTAKRYEPVGTHDNDGGSQTSRSMTAQSRR